MKKFISLCLCLLLVLAVFSGCSAGKKSGKISIVTTVFPLYDWISNIVGKDNKDVEITMLLDNGVDLHSYQPTSDDIITISGCDLFVLVGGESDAWADDLLKSAQNKDMKVVNLLSALDKNALEEQEKEGMQSEDEEEDEDEIEYDEHIWLSLKNAAICCEAIKNALCEKDPGNSELYTKNAEEYINKINELEAEYKQMADTASVKTLVFADRFPFAYLFHDYGLDYYAAFKGCSAETEASFETIIFLSKKIDELNLKNIMRIESSDGRIARTVKENTRAKNQKIVSLNSLQSVTKNQMKDGADYLKIMKENLEVLNGVTR